MEKIRASIIGASGYTGGELTRLLIMHPFIEIKSLTSERFKGVPITKLNPNLRSFTKATFVSAREVNPEENDVIFLCVPHEKSQDYVAEYITSPHLKIIDLSADFRLRDKSEYERYYSTHKYPELLKYAAYGLPEIHREEIKRSRLIGCAGCLPTSAILCIYPLVKAGVIDLDHIVIDSKIGSSAAGASFDISTHHPERQGVVRAYKPSGHRHIAEIEQELSQAAGKKINVSFSPHAVEMVRGIFTTVHAFLNQKLTDTDLWRLYRTFYSSCPFIRLVKDKETLHRYPEPKAVAGTNFADIGWEIDEHANRIVLMEAIDNLVKGSGGQAVQCMNIMFNLDEKTGLWYPGFHPY
ncbi:MAG: N-acetyl-gamma-glutamyl-phosphate reductase [Candidatus Anstonellales archaeon]